MIVMEARSARTITLALTFMVCAGQGSSLEEHEHARRDAETQRSQPSREPGLPRSLTALVALLECSNSAPAWQIGAHSRLPVGVRPTGNCAVSRPATMMRQKIGTLPLGAPLQKQQSGLWWRLRNQGQALAKYRKRFAHSAWARRAARLVRFAPAICVGASVLLSSGPALAAVASSALELKKKARQLETARLIFKWVAGISILAFLFRQIQKEDKDEMQRVKEEYERLENFKQQLISIDNQVDGDDIVDAVEKLQNTTTGSDAIKESLRMTKSELKALERKGRNEYEGIDDELYTDELGLDPENEIKEAPQKQAEPVKAEPKKDEKKTPKIPEDDDFFGGVSVKKKGGQPKKPDGDDDDDFFNSLR